MIKKIEHVGIIVSNMDRSIKFYEDVLHLQISRRFYVSEKVEIAFLYHPSQESLELELIKDSLDQNEGVVNHIAFQVTNLNETIAHLKKHGVEIEGKISQLSNGTKIVFFRGPDKEKLELVERPE